ncbi:uncharacterized protein AB9W97_017673 [Spinachia spinachia]
MSSVECLRDFVNERLSAAAEEIFGVFKSTIVEYQEEIDRQRRLLDVFWKPEVILHRIKLPQPGVFKEGVRSDQQLRLQERNSHLDQEDLDPPHIKEEQEELCSSPEEEQLEPKQETFTLTPTCDQLLDLCTDNTQSVVQETSLGYVSVESAALVEPSNDHQHLSHHSHQSDGKYFSHKNTLLLHVRRTHKRGNGDKRPYPCITCGKTFTRTSHLKSHTRSHTGERPYSCITCGKTFTGQSGLKFHTRTHTGERPYSCITCGKTFTRLDKLKSHTGTHTVGKPYSCKICERGFKLSSYLTAHMRRNHKGETS